jgi:hypothetical protein
VRSSFVLRGQAIRVVLMGCTLHRCRAKVAYVRAARSAGGTGVVRSTPEARAGCFGHPAREGSPSLIRP